ncbi:MAG: glycine cleavage system aminomethyltransferase GcvT, partial [Mammaliicoccus vitulinus]
MTTDLKKTPLYQTYIDQGAKVIDFSGWALPVQFSSIKEEHNAVRSKVGIFDVSHMGEIIVSGEEADQFIQYALTNDPSTLTDSKAQYTMLCNDKGG